MRKKLRIPEAYQSFAKAAWEQGWTISRTSKSHLAWTTPQGTTVFTPGTPSVKGVGIIRIKSKLRRAGLDI